MGTRRFMVAFVSIGIALVASVAPAGAATPSLKAQYAPVSVQISSIGKDIATDVNKAGTQTDSQLALQFAGLAKRAASSAITVSGMKGAKGTTMILQQQLALALTKGATDLAQIAVAASKHDANAAKKATVALGKDSAPIQAAHLALKKALGLSS